MSKNAPGARRRILIICGICFKESCPLSRWVDVDEDGGVSEEWDDIIGGHIDDLIADIHNELELANKPSIEEQQTLIQAATDRIQAETGNVVEVTTDTLLAQEVSRNRDNDEKTRIEDDGFLKSILDASSVQVNSPEKLRENSH